MIKKVISRTTNEKSKDIILENLSNAFKEDSNPIFAFNALIICHNNGFPPPKWAMDFLICKLEMLHDPQVTEKSLDVIFGFKKRSQKKDSTPIGSFTRQMRDIQLAFNMLLLIKKGFGLWKAADSICKNVTSDFEKNYGYMPAAGTIIKIYHRKKLYNSPKHLKAVNDLLNKGRCCIMSFDRIG